MATITYDWPNAPASGNITNVLPWEHTQLANANRLQVSPVTNPITGGKSGRFTVQSGDQPGSTSGYRNEVYSGGNGAGIVPLNVTAYHGFAFTPLVGNGNDWVNWCQFHGATSGSQPCFQYKTDHAGKMYVRSNPNGADFLVSSTTPYGKLIRVIIKLKPSISGAGICQAWVSIDGGAYVEKMNITTGNVGYAATYPKIGAYGSTSGTNFPWSVDHHKAVVNASSYAEVETALALSGGAPVDTTGPTLSVITPTSGQVITGNMPYSISVSDTSGIQSVAYALIGPSPATTVNAIFTETVAPYDDSSVNDPYSTIPLTDGDYTFRVIATDNAAAHNTTTVNVPVVLSNHGVTPTNVVPTASFTISPANPTTADTVTFTSTSTDPDGPLTSTTWDLTGDGVFDDGSGTVVTKNFPVAGDYTVRVKVIGGWSIPADDTAVKTQVFTVTGVAGPPDPPVDPNPHHGNGRITLKWTNADSYDVVTIRRRTDDYPFDDLDGDLVFTGSANNGTIMSSVTDQNVVNGVTYYYGIFAQTSGFYAPVLQVEATPNIVYRVQFSRGRPVIVGS